MNENIFHFICLIKPQFEVGKQNVGKGGIVKDPVVRAKAVAKVIEYACSLGFEYISHFLVFWQLFPKVLRFEE